MKSFKTFLEKKDHFVYQRNVAKYQEVPHRGTEQSSKDWIKKNAKLYGHKGKDFDIYKGTYPNVKPSDRVDYKYVAEEVSALYVSEELSVADGAGAWIDDFKKSDAPQFKGKSDEERRNMALAAYLSAKEKTKKEA